MKATTEVAKRYAKALFETVSASEIKEVLTQLRRVQAITSNPKMKELLCAPVLSKKEKIMIMSQITSDLNLNKNIESLLRLLADKNRIDNFDGVVSGFESISDEKNNVLRGTVAAATELTEKEKEEIEHAISKFTGRQLLLEHQKDPALVGGVLAKVGSYTFDGTLNTQLAKLKEKVNRSNY